MSNLIIWFNCLWLELIKKLINQTNKFELNLKLVSGFAAQKTLIHQAEQVKWLNNLKLKGTKTY